MAKAKMTSVTKSYDHLAMTDSATILTEVKEAGNTRLVAPASSLATVLEWAPHGGFKLSLYLCCQRVLLLFFFFSSGACAL